MREVNRIVVPVYNGYEMTKAAIASFDSQDVKTAVHVYDNGSDDWERVSQLPVADITTSPTRESVSSAWNYLIRDAFGRCQVDHVLVCNNDIELHPHTYRLLLEDGGDFVTPVGTKDRNSVVGVDGSGFRPHDKRPHPDFACFLIRRKAWDATGPFDESFEGAYCEDGDYHLRMHKAGIEAHSIGVPFFHRVSGTIAANPDDAKAIHARADANRKRFRDKWGFDQGSKAYYDEFNR